MLNEFTGICQNCAADITVIIHKEEILENCPECGEAPFGYRRITGLVYIVSNPNQRGVKIGMTTKTIEQRLKSLNSTGVPGSFVPIAIFPSDKPKEEEKRIHKKIEKYRIEKEHFELDPLDAVLKAYRSLNRKTKPIFFDSVDEKKFILHLEKAKIDMQIKLQGKKSK